ncbi:MAG: DUF4124 domain-containing protein [Nitrospira sp.]|nr:DUF4124 domain-containing protein [Nitrospira sp.]
MNMFLLSIVAGLLLSPVVSLAELYKWTDEQGHLHITDAPPAGTHKKSNLAGGQTPQSALPKKTRVRPIAPEPPRAEAHPLPSPNVTSPASEELPIQLTIEGLNPFEAMLTSPWQVFDNSERDAKAPVQSWKDKQGLDHFVDVLPITKGSAEAGTKTKDPSLSGPTRKGKEQAAGVLRSGRQGAE